MTRRHAPRIAFIIPCRNEAASIGIVLSECAQVLPGARCYVFDNSSSDQTAEIARQMNVDVRGVSQRGKGNVVRRMFADVEADVYVMTDGDATYDLAVVPQMIDRLVNEGLDMVVGVRQEIGTTSAAAYRPGHRWGNQALTRFVAILFGDGFQDMLSGLRVFSRRYVKSFPTMAKGFEIETELTVHALELRMPCGESPVPYRARMDGSESKLSTIRDGWRISRVIVSMFASERPLIFFGLIAGLLAATSVVLAVPILAEYWQTGLVPRLPTAVLSVGIMLSGLLALSCGAILQTVTLGRREAKRLVYLSIPRT